MIKFKIYFWEIQYIYINFWKCSNTFLTNWFIFVDSSKFFFSYDPSLENKEMKKLMPSQKNIGFLIVLPRVEKSLMSWYRERVKINFVKKATSISLKWLYFELFYSD